MLTPTLARLVNAVANVVKPDPFSEKALPQTWSPICGVTGGPLNLKGQCASCGCFDRR